MNHSIQSINRFQFAAETFPVLQQRMRLVIQTEVQLAQMEEKYLDTEAMNIDNSLQRCKKLTGTLITMKRYTLL